MPNLFEKQGLRGPAVWLWLVAVGGLPPLTFAGEKAPGALLDLARWRLTLPVQGDVPGAPAEIRPPELIAFVHAEHFFLNEQADGVVFRAHCGGVTTKGSSYPRCELRELANDPKRPAAWSTEDATDHSMTLRFAITATPAKKRHVVCAQIHDAEDDVMMIRLEGTKLFVERNEVERVMLDRRYQLGTPVEMTIRAGGGKIQVRQDGELKMDWAVSRDGCYFKAGCYTQSNPQRGDDEQAFGEVVIYRLQVEHGRGNND